MVPYARVRWPYAAIYAVGETDWRTSAVSAGHHGHHSSLSTHVHRVPNDHVRRPMPLAVHRSPAAAADLPSLTGRRQFRRPSPRPSAKAPCPAAWLISSQPSRVIGLLPEADSGLGLAAEVPTAASPHEPEPRAKFDRGRSRSRSRSFVGRLPRLSVGAAASQDGTDSFGDDEQVL